MTELNMLKKETEHEKSVLWLQFEKQVNEVISKYEPGETPGDLLLSKK